MKVELWWSRLTALLETSPKRLVLKGEQGMVLISSLLILAAVSLMAFGLAGDATTEVRIAGNRRFYQQAFNLSDGGTNVGTHVLLDHLYDAVDPETDYPGDGEIPLIEGSLYMSHFVMDPNILADIKGFSDNDNAQDPGNGKPDVSFDLSSKSGGGNPDDSTIIVDIDHLKAKLLAGSSIEFAAGYEGVGKGAGAGSVAIYYAVSSSTAVNSAKSEVVTVYRKVSNIIGGGQ
jgi:hypothetical protein